MIINGCLANPLFGIPKFKEQNPEYPDFIIRHFTKDVRYSTVKKHRILQNFVPKRIVLKSEFAFP